MPRYVYSILEERQWVMGDYLQGRRDNTIIDNFTDNEGGE